MPLTCPTCGYKGGFNSLAAIHLDGDASFDEIGIVALKCPQCRFKCAATYQVSRRGSIDSDARLYSVYQLERDDLDALIQLISKCPDPMNDQCSCEVHKTLGARNDKDVWRGLKNANFNNLIYRE